MRRRTAAFTLVELLVVIGILGVLMGLLLPAVSAAKRQATTALCATTLREISSASLLHAQEHRGYLPIAGEIVVSSMPSSGQNAYCSLLNDSLRRRYTYAMNTMQTMYTVVPLPGALAPYMGVKDLVFEDWDKLDQQLNDLRIRRHFSCPATDAMDRAKFFSNSPDTTLVGQALMVSFLAKTQFFSGWATNSDYAFNEGVMGYHWDSRYIGRRLRGNLTSISRSERVVLFSDAKPRTAIAYGFRPWISWTPSLNYNGTTSLADALKNNGRAADPTMFDRVRHKGRINVAFADGHVQTMMIDGNELQEAYLLP